MKVLALAALIVGLVPVQAVLLPQASLWGIMPDIGLIMVCMVGLFGGELPGLLFGFALGYVMSLFSAADPFTGMVTKGAVGYMAGLAGRHVVYLSPPALTLGILTASCSAGFITALLLKLNDQQSLWWAVWTVVLPQAVFDAVVGGVLYWVGYSRLNIERWVSEFLT